MPPNKIGKYRVEDRIGSGGMGEVFRAFDEDQHRWVAIKAIRSDAATDEERRRRFRREAKAVAKLDHPAIVQLYEIIESAEGEIIVMELVDGETLEKILQRGPLPPGQVLTIARGIIGGLAEAHGNGIIHRDLKAENIMVTPTGQAKILDFGLAKGLGPDNESQLTADGVLMGTTRAMSPEQVKGHPLDPRSDLFSLGSLIYEMTTGMSPFAGSNSLQTLKRVCTYHQTAIGDLIPEIPRALSDLVDHLLEKNPDHRPRNAEEVIFQLDQIQAALLTGQSSPSTLEHSTGFDTTLFPGLELQKLTESPAASRAGTETWCDSGQLGANPSRPAPLETDLLGNSRTRALRAKTNPTQALPAHSEPPVTRKGSSIDRVGKPLAKSSPRVNANRLAVVLFGSLCAAALILPRLREIEELRHVAVLRPAVPTGAGLGEATMAAGIQLALTRRLARRQRIFLVPTEESSHLSGPIPHIATALAADEVIDVALQCEARSCQAVFRRTNGGNGQTISLHTLELPLGDFRGIDTALNQLVDREYAELPRRPDTPSDSALPNEAFAQILALSTLVDQVGDVSEWAPLLRRLRSLRRRWPGILETNLLEAAAARRAYLGTRNEKYLDQAFATLENAERMAHDDPRIAELQFQVGVDRGQLDTAERSLERLAELEGESIRVSKLRARLLERSAEPERALTLLRQVVQRRPGWKNLLDLAALEQRTGEIDAARGHAGAALALAPEVPEILQLVRSLESSTTPVGRLENERGGEVAK